MWFHVPRHTQQALLCPGELGLGISVGKGQAQGYTSTWILFEFFLRPKVLWRVGTLGCFLAPLVRLPQEVSCFFLKGTHTRSASSALESCYQDRVGTRSGRNSRQEDQLRGCSRIQVREACIRNQWGSGARRSFCRKLFTSWWG